MNLLGHKMHQVWFFAFLDLPRAKECFPHNGSQWFFSRVHFQSGAERGQIPLDQRQHSCFWLRLVGNAADIAQINYKNVLLLKLD